MPYKFVHRRHDIKKWLKRQAQLALVVIVVSLVFGIVAMFVAERVCYVRGLSLDKIVASQKQKLLSNYKKQYGDNWQENAIKQYKEKYGADWKEHAKADYQKLYQ
jgi:hypothetical protein